MCGTVENSGGLRPSDGANIASRICPCQEAAAKKSRRRSAAYAQSVKDKQVAATKKSSVFLIFLHTRGTLYVKDCYLCTANRPIFRVGGCSGSVSPKCGTQTCRIKMITSMDDGHLPENSRNIVSEYDTVHLWYQARG